MEGVLLGRTGPAGPVLVLSIARVCKPGSKLATIGGQQDTTLAGDLTAASASTDDVRSAMDWLANRVSKHCEENRRQTLPTEANPDRFALFDVSSLWVTRTHFELAARGYSRERKKAQS